VAFDLLALGDRDLTAEPFADRRRLLEGVLSGALARIHVTPMTEMRTPPWTGSPGSKAPDLTV